MSKTHIVGICGSLRDGSHSRTALRVALETSANYGASTDLIDLRKLDLPLYDPDEDQQGDSDELTERVQRADGVILATPMYHGSYSSIIKTAMDYCGFDEFENKTVGLLAVSGGSFPVTALDQLRIVCRAVNAWVLPLQVGIPNASDVVDDEITDESIEDRVKQLGHRVVKYANIEADEPTFESTQNVGGE